MERRAVKVSDVRLGFLTVLGLAALFFIAELGQDTFTSESEDQTYGSFLLQDLPHYQLTEQDLPHYRLAQTESLYQAPWLDGFLLLSP